MGAEHSQHRHSIVLEMELEAAKIREALKALDTKCEVLKYENNYLRGQVINLNEKVEMSEIANKEQKLKVSLEMNNFEKRIQILELQSIVKSFSTSSEQASATTFTPSEVYKSSAPIGICQERNLPAKKEKGNASNQKGVSSVNSNKVHTLKYYDHPLPSTLVELCTVSRCGLCCKNLVSQLLASEHYWSRKHFEELQAYLDKIYKNTSQLRPKFKPSLTYNRPLPEAIILKCSKEKCGLCNVTFSGSCYKLARDHYHGSEHNKEILKFLQKNTEHWQEGLMNTSNGGSTSLKTASPESSSVAAPASWLPSLSQSVPAETRSKFKQDCCELCKVTLICVSVARNHYKGKRHVENVHNLLKPEDTENIFDVSEDLLDYDDEVMLSDSTKEVITVSESCSAAPGLDLVFIGNPKN